MRKPTHTKILITGAVSLLGRYLIQQLSDRFQLFLAFHRVPQPVISSPPQIRYLSLDVTNLSQVEKTISDTCPDVVIHLAAVSNIEYCQTHPKETRTINIDATSHLCQILSHSPTQLIFTSSSQVFSGQNAPYRETSLPHPVSIYGKTKLSAEKIILKTKSLSATIIRFATMFGWPPDGARENDAIFYLQRLQNTKKIYLVNDRFYNPIYALRAAQIIDKVIKMKTSCIFHVGGQDRVSRYSFVQNLISAFDIKNPPILVPVTGNYFKNFFPRPLDTTLSTGKVKQMLRFTPTSLITDLRHMVNHPLSSD